VRRLVGASSFSLLSWLALSPAAIAAPAVVAFDFPAGPLGPALISYARQAHRQVLYDAGLVEGRARADWRVISPQLIKRW
jgi:hypothetical protein